MSGILQGLLASIGAAEANYIEDVFSTYLYTGNGTTQTITNGIDLAGEGGLVWIKSRNASNSHQLADTARGVGNILFSNSTLGQQTYNNVSGVSSSGFSVDGSIYSGTNTNSTTYASWTFRKQPKFFDIVTYTGNGASTPQTLNHNLGSVPGMIIVKYLNTGADYWYVWHRGDGTTPAFLGLNSTTASFSSTYGSSAFLSAAPTSTTFSVKNVGFDGASANATGEPYVAYLFAHNAGGFGTAGTDNVISCGSFSPNGSSQDINLGYEPQWILIKRTAGARDWFLVDNMRGWTANSASSNSQVLNPNLSAAESDNLVVIPTATGFTIPAFSALNNDAHIYMAIRRPMAVPTVGTTVFAPVVQGFDGFVNTGFVTDLIFGNQFTGGNNWRWVDRLRGGDKSLGSNSTSGESAEPFWKFDFNNGVNLTYGGTIPNWVWWNLRRAPGFFDEVCYTGTGSATTFNHNLGVAPELMIVKYRNVGGSNSWWAVYSSATGASNYLRLNATDASASSSTLWNATAPTASVFSVGSAFQTNDGSGAYVAYLFATCLGVSKVGSYTGTGATLNISCGFTGGARFVLIKRTDSTGNWWIWNTARGMIAGTDPRLALNTTDAEANNDWVLTITGGFSIVTTDATVNASGGSYIFLAVA